MPAQLRFDRRPRPARTGGPAAARPRGRRAGAPAPTACGLCSARPPCPIACPVAWTTDRRGSGARRSHDAGAALEARPAGRRGGAVARRQRDFLDGAGANVTQGAHSSDFAGVWPSGSNRIRSCASPAPGAASRVAASPQPRGSRSAAAPSLPCPSPSRSDGTPPCPVRPVVHIWCSGDARDGLAGRAHRLFVRPPWSSLVMRRRTGASATRAQGVAGDGGLLPGLLPACARASGPVGAAGCNSRRIRRPSVLGRFLHPGLATCNFTPTAPASRAS